MSTPTPANGAARLSMAALNPCGIAQQRRDVVEVDAGLREVGDFADAALEEIGWRALL
jgi:hypothetical protein